MLTKFRQTRRAFTTVEILVAVGLVAILMVVAVPRLLDSRKTVSDSAAKQQLNTVMLSAQNYFAERDTFKGLLETVAGEIVLEKRVDNVDIVGPSEATGRREGQRALQVSAGLSGTGDTILTLVASNGETNCWMIKLAPEGTTYGYKANTSPDNCNAGTSFSSTDSFEFPTAAN